MRLAAALLSLLLAAGPACAQPRAESLADAPIEWTIRGATEPGRVQLEISRRTAHSQWTTGHTVDLATLDGLTAAQLAGDGGPVSFRIVRDAGTLACEGVARRGRGTGQCTFAASAAFAEALDRRGIGRPSATEQFSMALNDIGYAYVDALARLGYATPRASELADAGNHGVTLAYLTGMGAHGYRVGSLPVLIRMRDHGVTPDYVEALAASGVRDIPADGIVRLRDHGVMPGFVVALRANGYRGFGPDDIVQLRDHGVTADYVAGLRSLGYSDLTADEMVRLRDHGVMPEFIRDANRGGGRHTPEELVRLRTGG